ncbi:MULTISPECIES: DUF2207 domain-containing protein [Aequorivita]|uniref:DUF2207 domain-containing protein n=1 Tax=Aequorivita iocasae TaxID=2803865 RepID=A0ABX7DNH1_9FLAO|nr:MULTISPECIES: DUF2207 domain-containing protein [Aequorivita]QQX75650.1 DUF2207 domain-containing protein [Aequorivita iocasae]UCA55106.1 DUF2207 domain-containing protein [Aequorivita sp. F7]
MNSIVAINTKINNLLLDKKLFLLFFGMLFFLKTSAQDFIVNKCVVDIYISEEGYFDVMENYDITFTAHKHGIFRTIRTNYDLFTEDSIQEKRKIKIRNIEVPNHKYEADFDFVQKISDNLQIKIGDKNKTIIGPQHYEIKYRVYNAFLFGDSQIRFYWNIKSDMWQTVFEKIDFNIHPPENVDVGLDNIFIYTDFGGETNESTEYDINYENGVFKAKSLPRFKSYLGQNVTVLLNLPLGSVEEIKPWWPFWTNYGWTLILAVLLVLFYWVWNKYGKDDRVVATTSYFPPSGIDPAMAGFLIDDTEDTQDLIALIPYWGSRGIITMEQIPKKGWFGKDDTKLTKLKPLPDGAPDYERKIFDGLFGSSTVSSKQEVLISSLKDSFYTKMASAKTLLKAKAQIYYEAEAKKMQTRTIIATLLLGVFLFGFFLLIWGLFAALAVIPVTVFLLFMTVHLVKKNTKGNKMLSELKGFKSFIKIAEENKLKMLLRDSPSYFETTMGYALAFGLFNQWTKKFEALDLQPPSWYTSSTGAITMHNFSQSFSDSISTAKATMVSSPSSSSSGGGGSSGGGFGGGGGGSW